MTKRLPSAPPILPGLAYVRPLGSGGFADVFLYEQDMPRRNVAVKVLPSDVRDPELRRMFNAEADVLAHLSAHPVDRHRLSGRDLGRRPPVHRHGVLPRLARAALPHRADAASRRCSTIGVRMASALESAHRAGLIHRDVKPSNILITTFGAPVLADFGISSSLPRATADEVLAMSMPWSAPEVIAEADGRHRRERGVEPRRHRLFAAGRAQPVRADASGGRTRRSSCAAASRVRATPPIPRTDVPGALQAVLATRDEPRPARSATASARAFAEALREVQAELGLAPTPLEVAGRRVGGGIRRRSTSRDTALRGPRAVAHRARRPPQDPPGRRIAALARDEDTDVHDARRAGAPCAGRGSSRRGRRRWPSSRRRRWWHCCVTGVL